MPAGFRIWVCTALAAWQVAVPPASIQQRLDRVQADLFSRAEHLPEDVKELKAILALDPRSAVAHTLLGIAYSTLGTKDLKGEAIGEFRQALDLDSNLVPVRFYLAHLYLDLGRPARAKEELEAALVKVPGNPEFLALLGESERRLKNPGRAVEATRQALKADESFAQARYYLGLALLDLGQRDEAIKELELLVRAGSTVTDTHLALGNAYIDAGRSPEAIETLVQGLRLDPQRPELHIALARAYRTNKMLDKADAELAPGLAAFAKASASAKASADRAAGKSGRGAAADTSDYPYQQVELDYQLELGQVKLQRGQLALAAEAFKKVLELDPKHEAATRGLAEVNRRLAAKKPGGGQ